MTMDGKRCSNFLTVAAVVIVLSFVWVGCANKPTYPNINVAPVKSVAQWVAQDTSYQLLLEALTKTQLADTLAASGSYTVFAPKDSAFMAAGIMSKAQIDSIAALPNSWLRGLLKYHILGSSKANQDFALLQNALVSLQGTPLYVTKTADNSLFVNGIPITSITGIAATNGYVYPLSGLLTIPTKTITQILFQNKDLSTLDTLLKKSNAVKRAFDSVSLANSALTIFAPTNEAFTAANIKPTLPDDSLSYVILYHILPKRYFSADLSSLTSVITSFRDSTLTITGVSNKVAGIKGHYNVGNAMISVGDSIATNGVVHIIDSVLAPFPLK